MSTAVATRTRPRTSFRRISTVLVADRIEPSLEFWVDRLGFEVRLQVDGDAGIEFAVVGRDDVEVMYRSRDTLGASGFEPEVSAGASVLYVQVDDLDALADRLDGVEVLAPLTQDAFGARAVYVREPSGTIVALCDHEAA